MEADIAPNAALARRRGGKGNVALDDRHAQSNQSSPPRKRGSRGSGTMVALDSRFRGNDGLFVDLKQRISIPDERVEQRIAEADQQVDQHIGGRANADDALDEPVV